MEDRPPEFPSRSLIPGPWSPIPMPDAPAQHRRLDPADHESALLRYANHLLRDPARAQDVVQDTFERYWRQPPEWREELTRTDQASNNGHNNDAAHPRSLANATATSGGGGRLKAWLFTVCRNRAFDVIEKERRMTSLTEPITATRAHDGPGPDRVAEQRDTHAAVLDRLAGLPGNQQEVVRLKFQAELSYRQIAEVTGLTVSHVGNLLHHALKTLRAELATPD